GLDRPVESANGSGTPPQRPEAGALLVSGVREIVGEVDQRVHRTTRGLLGLGTLLPVALVTWSIAQVVRGRATPLSWTSALWYAHGLVRDYQIPTPRDLSVAYEIAHSVRGRLRIRYPAPWVRARRDVVESDLRALPGVRTVSGSTLTGSVRIEYDPFRLAEHGIVQALEEIHARLGAPAPRRHRPAAPIPRVTGTGMPLLGLLGATSVLASTLLPAPPALVAGLVAPSWGPPPRGAAAALGRRRLNGDVLEATTLLLLTARRHYAGAALLTWFRAAGEYVVARTVVTARRSLHEVIAPPDAVVPRIEDGQARPVRVPTLRVGDVIVVGAGEGVRGGGNVVGGEAHARHTHYI